MARRKSTPSKRPLAPPPCTPKRLKRAKASRHQRTEPLPLSCSGADDGWGEADVLWLQFPAPPSLTVAVKDEAALQLRVNLTLVENDQVILQPRGREGAGVSNQLSLTELFPDTYDAWKLHIATLAERGLLRLHADGKREKAADAWSFSLSFGVAWRKYMETCIAQGWTPTVAAPRAAPMRAMHHVMIWLLKKTHDAQGDELMCKFRYWKEIEVMYDRFVGDNSCECSKFKDDTFAMPEIYAYIDAERQLTRDFGEYEAIESNSSGLLPTLRRYQKAAVSWMLSRENPSRHCDRTLPLCITFSEAINSVLQAYDPFCAVFHATSSSDTLLLEQFRPVRQDFSSIRGGILADEMGLGKTVEVIALVLNRRSVLLKPRLLSTHTLRGNQDDNEGDGVQDDVIACICGSPDNHPMGLVQCAFCGTWHHQLCTGYVTGDDSEQSSISSNSHNVWDFETCESISAEEESKWTTKGFMCYHCQSHERPSFSCRTTLVVSPEPIHAQWEREISRHVSAGALSVMRYPGVRAVRTRLESVGPSAEWQVLASPGLVLSRYDVVLTTYEALGADLRHVPTPEGGNRRSSTRSQHKRYAFVSSPLVALHFWRVCMDEAQVGVENTRLQAALTLSRLSADNRWVVTGTPFSSHVSELFGYLRFLRIPPYTSSASHQSEDNLQLLQSEHNERESVDLGFFRESVEHCFIRGAIERVLELLLWNGHDADSVTENGGGILWRTGKKHVVDQLGLPPQTNEVIWCRFAAVERHFYDQQEKRIVSLIQQRQRQRHQLDQSKDTIARDDRLWEDLLILRQVCCHPQVGGARQAWGYGGNSTGRTVMTMDAFLQELLTKAIRECEEAQRELIGAQNGMAALLVLNNDFSGAALKYMAEMSSIRANWSKFRADLLPRLHILENLEKCVRKLYTLPLSPAGFDAGIVSSENAKPTADPKKMCLLPDLLTLDKRISSSGLLPETEDLRDEDRISIARECALLKQNARHIRQFYLFQTDAMHAKAFHDFKMIFDQIDENREYSGAQPEMLCTSGTWWNDALAVVEENEQKSELQLITRIHARLSGFDTRWGELFCSQLVSTRSLRLLLVRELEGLAKRRRVLFKRLAALSEGTPTADEVELSGNCAKCRDGGSGPICVHCQLYKELDAYRQHFLGIDKSLATNSRFTDTPDDQNGSDYDDESTGAVPHKSGGGLSVSLFVEVFREISSCARSMLRSHRNGKAHSDNLQSALQRETEFWVKLQREWQAAKKLFQAQHQRLGALDELAMACSQLRLRQPGEPIGRTKAERLYKLEAAVVPIRAEELEVDRQAADLDLRDCTSQLRYLLQLFGETATRQPPPEELRDVNSSSLSTRPVCAVCLQEFTQKRAVLPCAHSFCTACISTLAGAQQHTRKSVSCPSCRRVCTVGSITEVVEASETDSENQAQSKGISDVPQHRTGGGLGSKLDALLMRVDMLRQDNPSVKCLLFSQWSQMLELAVQALPRIGVRCYMYGTKRQLPQLLSQFQTCPAACVLALPFKVGANGLNIVEATEVLLIEPLLSSSIEAQAVNRVHRLGQTQRTRVHRFIVQNTVEERIYRLMHKQKNESTTLEQNVNSESDEDEGLQRLGVAPGRKEQEKLTMQDLQTLLQGEMQGNATAVQQSAAVDPFWEELVKLNGKCVNRHEACEFLERRHATEVRGDSQNLHSQEPHTRLVDKLVSLLVARELLDLPYQSEDSGAVPERLDPQILQHHRERIYAEIRVWRETTRRVK